MLVISSPSLPHPDSDISLTMIEGSLTLIFVALAFSWPRLAAPLFSRIERLFGKLARRQGWAVASVGMAALLLRLAILPFCPIPLPFVTDDFSFMLSAQTFELGRLTNPTPAMWKHLETIHVSMNPTYQSMYFPAQGLLMAASKVLFGHPWFGLLIMSALMCAGICWMLQAWLPPTWALLGGVLSILHLGLFSYWINTYHAGGCIVALAGALVLGSLPRLKRTSRLRYSLLMAAGIALMGITRPYEGFLLCIPVSIALGRWIFSGKNRPNGVALLRLTTAPVLLVSLTVAWLAYYDYRAFGSPTTLPYTLNRATYAVAPYYVWQSPHPEPAYRSKAMHDFYVNVELVGYTRMHSVSGFFRESLIKLVRSFLFYAGIALLVPLIMLRRVSLDHRIRFLIVCVLVLAAGMSIEIFLIPHYLATFTAAFYAIGLQAMRHLWVWKPESKPVGKMLVRLTVTTVVVMAGARTFAEPLRLRLVEWPASEWNGTWYGPGHFGTDRANIESRLASLPRKQLVLVRYSPNHDPFDEWVYNSADIDGSKVIWAREMDSGNNMELIRYYRDRQVWLLQPDSSSPALSPYPMPAQQFSASVDTH